MIKKSREEKQEEKACSSVNETTAVVDEIG
jgi:hypothetical protein